MRQRLYVKVMRYPTARRSAKPHLAVAKYDRHVAVRACEVCIASQFERLLHSMSATAWK